MSEDALLQGVVEAAEAQRQLSEAELSRRTLRVPSTILRRSHLDVIDWPCRDVLLLGRSDERLSTAIITHQSGRMVPTGDPAAIPKDLVAEVDASNGVAGAIRFALADGAIDAREIDRIISALMVRQEQDAHLLRDLQARRKQLARVRA